MLGIYRKIGTLGSPHQEFIQTLSWWDRALLIIVLEAPSIEFHTGCPCELLYAGDLINAESIDRWWAAGKVEDLKIRDGEKVPANEHGKIQIFVTSITRNLDLLEI